MSPSEVVVAIWVIIGLSWVIAAYVVWRACKAKLVEPKISVPPAMYVSEPDWDWKPKPTDARYRTAAQCEDCCRFDKVIDQCCIGHQPRYFQPRSPVDDNWGWKRRCQDFWPMKPVTVRVAAPEELKSVAL